MTEEEILAKKIFKNDVLASIIMAEEVARELRESKEEKIEEIVVKKPVCETKIKRKYNENVQGVYDILVLNNAKGKLREMSIVTSSKNYILELIVDDFKFYNDTWDELNAMSNYSSYVDAFESDNNYVLRIGETYFRKNLVIRVRSLELMTIKRLIVVYDICQ